MEAGGRYIAARLLAGVMGSCSSQGFKALEIGFLDFSRRHLESRSSLFSSSDSLYASLYRAYINQQFCLFMILLLKLLSLRNLRYSPLENCEKLLGGVSRMFCNKCLPSDVMIESRLPAWSARNSSTEY